MAAMVVNFSRLFSIQTLYEVEVLILLYHIAKYIMWLRLQV